jgi:3-hydroxyacyl-[acyl-carrier-protein] dehydratase
MGNLESHLRLVARARGNYTFGVDDAADAALEYDAIARILPHRYPFLLVDRITELERPPHRRHQERHDESFLTHSPGEPPAVPPTILTECVAQVGAILILSKPENHGKLILFRGMERVRFRRPVYAGDVVEIEARVKRLRSRMGQLEGFARVNGQVVVDGAMTFALE